MTKANGDEISIVVGQSIRIEFDETEESARMLGCGT